MIRSVRSFFQEVGRNRTLFVMLLPAVVMIFVFSYVPIYGITLAFKDYQYTKGILGSPWVGFKYFTSLFSDMFLARAFKNTLLLGIYSLLWGFPAPIVFALFLNELKSSAFKRAAQTISYFPYFISAVILVGILKEMFSVDGVINHMMGALGIQPVNFFSKAEWFRSLYIGSGIWQGIGYSSIIYLAAIAGIDPELYEAAVMDGANRFQQMRHITLPCLYPTIRVLLLFSIGGLLGTNFDKVFLMYSPATYATSDVLSTYIYRYGIEGGGFGYATAVGLLNSVISFLLLLFANFTSKKLSGSGLF